MVDIDITVSSHIYGGGPRLFQSMCHTISHTPTDVLRKHVSPRIYLASYEDIEQGKCPVILSNPSHKHQPLTRRPAAYLQIDDPCNNVPADKIPTPNFLSAHRFHEWRSILDVLRGLTVSDDPRKLVVLAENSADQVLFVRMKTNVHRGNLPTTKGLV